MVCFVACIVFVSHSQYKTSCCQWLEMTSYLKADLRTLGGLLWPYITGLGEKGWASAKSALGKVHQHAAGVLTQQHPGLLEARSRIRATRVLHFYKYTVNSPHSSNAGGHAGDQSEETFLCVHVHLLERWGSINQDLTEEMRVVRGGAPVLQTSDVWRASLATCCGSDVNNKMNIRTSDFDWDQVEALLRRIPARFTVTCFWVSGNLRFFWKCCCSIFPLISVSRYIWNSQLEPQPEKFGSKLRVRNLSPLEQPINMWNKLECWDFLCCNTHIDPNGTKHSCSGEELRMDCNVFWCLNLKNLSSLT